MRVLGNLEPLYKCKKKLACALKLHEDNDVICLTVYKATVVRMDLKKDADIYDLKVDQVLKEGMVHYFLNVSDHEMHLKCFWFLLNAAVLLH